MSMTNLDQLLQELCPDGVKFRELQEILKIKNGGDYKKFKQGNVPVYGSGGIMTYVDTAAYDKPSVLIPRKGSLDKLYYVTEPFWNVDTVFYTEIDESYALPRYVYHCLKREHLEQYNMAGGVPSLTQKVLNKVKIPLPPLPIQSEIVKILDNFTELTAELTARKKQYEYYRDLLLSFDSSQSVNVERSTVKWVALREIADISRGKVISKDFIHDNPGIYPVYSSQTQNNGELGKISSFDYCGEYLTWTTDGANAGSIFYRTGKFSITNVCGLLSPHTDVIYTRFLFHILTTIAKSYVNAGMGNPKLMSNVMANIKIPVPSIEMQKNITAILDRFDALCNDLTSGLPAEIAARQKQYEYYRDKLLTFKELTA